jgi:serine/threonine-protein kinase
VQLGKALRLAPADTSILYTAALIWEQLGERAQALDFLGRALRGGYSLELVERSPGMKMLRADPRYARLIQDLRLKK